MQSDHYSQALKPNVWPQPQQDFPIDLVCYHCQSHKFANFSHSMDLSTHKYFDCLYFLFIHICFVTHFYMSHGAHHYTTSTLLMMFITCFNMQFYPSVLLQ